MCTPFSCRVFRYDPGENFHPHLDGSNVNENGDRSYLSVHIFLNEVRNVSVIFKP